MKLNWERVNGAAWCCSVSRRGVEKRKYTTRAVVFQMLLSAFLITAYLIQGSFYRLTYMIIGVREQACVTEQLAIRWWSDGADIPRRYTMLIFFSRLGKRCWRIDEKVPWLLLQFPRGVPSCCCFNGARSASIVRASNEVFLIFKSMTPSGRVSSTSNLGRACPQGVK